MMILKVTKKAKLYTLSIFFEIYSSCYGVEFFVCLFGMKLQS